MRRDLTDGEFDRADEFEDDMEEEISGDPYSDDASGEYGFDDSIESENDGIDYYDCDGIDRGSYDDTMDYMNSVDDIVNINEIADMAAGSITSAVDFAEDISCSQPEKARTQRKRHRKLKALPMKAVPEKKRIFFRLLLTREKRRDFYLTEK